ncbi:MAG: hypothetical protein WCW66_05370 [Patescibacteria group bacterium]
MSKEIPDLNQGGVDDKVVEQLSDELDEEVQLVDEIIAELSPEEMSRMQQMSEGQMELSDDTLAKLKILSERVAQLLKNYGEKYGPATAGLVAGGVITALGISKGWMGVAESGSAGTIFAALVMTVTDSLQHNRAGS